MNTGVVPALVPVVDHSSTGSDRPHFGIEVRIKEKCEGKTIVFCNVLHAMRLPTVAAAREAVQHALPEFRHPLRKKVWPVERRSSLHERVVLTQLRAKIDAFFQVGLARGEFASQREISPPSPAAT